MAEILIGSLTFPRKADAVNYIREVRLRSRAAGPGVEDDEFLRDLVALHPDATDKVGSGIERFEVRRNGNNEGFWIIRADGSATDFSFVKCLYGTSQEAKVQSAMRDAIVDQRLAAREAAFLISETLICPVTGVPITRANCHMDHDAPTFLELADSFAVENGGYSTIKTISLDGALGRRFTDEDTMRKWQIFHAKRAHLRAVSKMANLSVLRRGVRRKKRKSN